MKLMNENNLSLMQALVNIDDISLKNNLAKVMKNFYNKKKIHNKNEYLYVEGDIPVALCAHVDTVFEYTEKELMYDKEKNVLWSPDGAGFDDRAGVFAILKILGAGFRPYIFFSTGEEKGGLGASKASTDLISKCKGRFKYMIELDRRGEKDCVFYNDDNAEFSKYVETFGFKENYGSFSDISYFAPAFGCSAVNLSIGYLDEHTLSERLYVDWLFETIERTKNMLKVIDAAPYFEYIEIQHYGYYNYSMDGGLEYSTAFNSIKSYTYNGREMYKCEACGKWFPTEEVELAKDEGDVFVFCKDCAPYYTATCQMCGELFVCDKDCPDLLCPDCKDYVNVGGIDNDR